VSSAGVLFARPRWERSAPTGSAGVFFARPRWDRGLHRRAAPGSSSLGPGGIAVCTDGQRRGLLRSAPVGSRWTAVSGPLAQKTPTLPTGPLG